MRGADTSSAGHDLFMEYKSCMVVWRDRTTARVVTTPGSWRSLSPRETMLGPIPGLVPHHPMRKIVTPISSVAKKNIPGLLVCGTAFGNMWLTALARQSHDNANAAHCDQSFGEFAMHPIKIAWFKLSKESLLRLGTPRLKTEITLESNPLTPTKCVGEPGVGTCHDIHNLSCSTAMHCE